MPIDYEAEYNNGRRVPEYPQIAERWAARAAAYRQGMQGASLDIAYGPAERCRYDYFPAGDGAPVVIFIHGGYWQRGDRKVYSFLAASLNAAGLSLVLPSYRLCPETSVAGIIEDIRLCVLAVHRHTGRRPLVAGHSAGGHLTAAMLATDWSRIPGSPPGLVRAGYAISGLFELEPLIATSINEAVRLDLAGARAASPILWPPPPPGTALVAAVGGIESSEFLRQSRLVADTWGRAGVSTEYAPIAGANHFTVLEPLADAGSDLVQRLAALARNAQ
jgi:arylformamidase